MQSAMGRSGRTRWTWGVVGVLTLGVALTVALGAVRLASRHRRFVSQPLPDGSRYTFLYPANLQTVHEAGGRLPLPSGAIAAVTLQSNGPINAPASPWDWFRQRLGFAVPFSESVSVMATPAEARVSHDIRRAIRRSEGWVKGDEVRRNQYLHDPRTQLQFSVYHSCYAAATPPPAAALQVRAHNSAVVRSFEVLPPGSSIPAP